LGGDHWITFRDLGDCGDLQPTRDDRCRRECDKGIVSVPVALLSQEPLVAIRKRCVPLGGVWRRRRIDLNDVREPQRFESPLLDRLRKRHRIHVVLRSKHADAKPHEN